MGDNATHERWYLAAGILASLAAGVFPFLIAPTFQSVYRSLNRDLPLLTNLALRFYPALLAVPAALIAICWMLPKGARRGKVIYVIGVGGLLLLPAAYIFVMYLPIL